MVGQLTLSRFQPSCVMLLCFCVVMATGKIITNDPNCLKIGGLCVDYDTCPPQARVNQTGLCAHESQRKGVCCHSPPTDSTCREQGGRCGYEEECRNVINFGTLDCENGSECCLLIF
ncbi:hypothetical protein JTE90_011062 [Oedothorax gibbosus]|uniref:Carboxypeptidase inhibitor n=1 Tax=Oedothorax gibbosus TaxID=931172 RepID=A0AAV6VEK6_9ARAC|nr:hypothetical protein JTE90_011062 [Oedothorax gibbosus]